MRKKDEKKKHCIIYADKYNQDRVRAIIKSNVINDNRNNKFVTGFLSSIYNFLSG